MELDIRYNDRDRGLEAYVRQQRFPLHFQQKDVFKDVSIGVVTFQRGPGGRVTGYLHSSQPGQIFAILPAPK